MATDEDILEGIISRRGSPTIGGNPHAFVKLFGGKIVPFSNYEPDPITFRDEFYYNTRLNQLFKKRNVGGVPVWDRISRI